MRRFLDFILRNWPLKLAALGLATVLYAGVVLSEDTRTWPGQVPIEVLSPPLGGALLDVPGSVTSIRYRAPLDVASRLTSGSFHAAIDLSGVTPQAGGPPVEVPVELVPIDARVEIVDYSPRVVNVRVDEVVSRTLPVTVERGSVPDGLVLGPSQVTPSSVSVRGASSRVASVHSVTARVAIDDSGLNVDQEVDLDALDESGELVTGVQLDPQRALVRIDVARQLAYATLPVVPVLTGDPAPGVEVTSVTAQPVTVTVSGEAPAVARLTSIHTQALDIGGRSGDLQASVGLDLPPDVSVIGEPSVQLSVSFASTQASRSWQLGVSLPDARADRTYSLSTPSVVVTLAGDVATLDALTPADVTVSVAVANMAPGHHEVAVTVDTPKGLELVSVSPARITVRVAVPAISPSPAAPAQSAPGPASPAVSAPPSMPASPAALAPLQGSPVPALPAASAAPAMPVSHEAGTRSVPSAGAGQRRSEPVPTLVP